MVKLSTSRFSQMPKNTQDNASECLECIWPFLQFSRIFGICPISRCANKLYIGNPIWWTLTCINLVIQVIFINRTVNDIIEYTGKVDLDEILLYWNDALYYLQTCGNMLFVIWKIRLIPKFLEACTRIEDICKIYRESKDERIVKKCHLLFIFLTVLEIFGTLLFYLSEGNELNKIYYKIQLKFVKMLV